MKKLLAQYIELISFRRGYMLLLRWRARLFTPGRCMSLLPAHFCLLSHGTLVAPLRIQIHYSAAPTTSENKQFLPQRK